MKILLLENIHPVAVETLKARGHEVELRAGSLSEDELIAEYFTTTDSVGKAVNTSLALYQYDRLWALVVVVTLASILLYMVAQAGERVVLARFGQTLR